MNDGEQGGKGGEGGFNPLPPLPPSVFLFFNIYPGDFFAAIFRFQQLFIKSLTHIFKKLGVIRW